MKLISLLCIAGYAGLLFAFLSERNQVKRLKQEKEDLIEQIGALSEHLVHAHQMEDSLKMGK